MNSNVHHKLREGAKTLRDLAAAGASVQTLREKKHDLLQTIHRMLCIHLGSPPESFFWQWNDKDKNFGRDGEMTPQQFAEKYVSIPIEDYVCLVHDPRETSPFGRTYTVQYLGNIVGGDPVIYLNVDISLMKQIAMEQVTNGEPVWFGCDVGPMMRRDMGLWDAKLFDYEGVYNTKFSLSKADRLTYHQSMMTHAMLFTGVDVVDGKPRRWRVENSWGEEGGKKGFYVMNDSWFDEYLLEIAAPKRCLPEELLEAFKEPPIVLPPWDPMGSLAAVRG